MSWLDEKYVLLLSPTFRNFKQKRIDPPLYEFSCPICGDSATDTTKARGYIYDDDGDLKFKCHNCDWSNYFSVFLKFLDPELYRSYIVDKFGEKKSKKKEIKIPSNLGKATKKKLKDHSNSVDRIFEELDSHAVEYLDSRRIPNYEDFRYLSDMRKLQPFIDSSIKLVSEPRIIIPVKNKEGTTVGVSCRTLNPKNKLRYLNLKFTEDQLLYNIQRVNPKQSVYVLEGVLDSKFIDNSIAVCGSDLFKAANEIPKENLVLVFDNQPRNREIVSKISNAVKQKFSVVIWPKDFERKGKDINQMVLDGNVSRETIQEIIQNNTYQGMEAFAKFQAWKKI